MFGVRGNEAINKFLAEIGLPPVNLDDDEWYEWEEKNRLPSLVNAHLECLRTFFENVRVPNKRDQLSRGARATTPLGEREFSSFEFLMYYDPHEMGDTPETAVLGVGLSGRYVPTFLDWRGAHGCIEHVKLDDHTMQMIAKAKEEICKVVPAASTFEVVFVECHY